MDEKLKENIAAYCSGRLKKVEGQIDFTTFGNCVITARPPSSVFDQIKLIPLTVHEYRKVVCRQIFDGCIIFYVNAPEGELELRYTGSLPDRIEVGEWRYAKVLRVTKTRYIVEIYPEEKKELIECLRQRKKWRT